MWAILQWPIAFSATHHFPDPIVSARILGISGGGWDDSKLFIAIAGLVGTFAVAFCLMACKETCKEVEREKKMTDNARLDSTHLCPLCQEEIPQGLWNDGTHRKECAEKNNDKLRSLPKPKPPVGCSDCGKVLRLWNCSQGEEVRCYVELDPP